MVGVLFSYLCLFKHWKKIAMLIAFSKYIKKLLRKMKHGCTCCIWLSDPEYIQVMWVITHINLFNLFPTSKAGISTTRMEILTPNIYFSFMLHAYSDVTISRSWSSTHKSQSDLFPSPSLRNFLIVPLLFLQENNAQ